MTVPRTWWKALLAALAAVFLLQLGASLLVRTRRMHSYLAARLAREFGRPVEVSSFDAQLLPAPRLDALGVTVGEDPAFGNEYFLRAEGLSASLRWTGFLHGRFELGTLSLIHPSLILVRNAEHRWNLERWLTPAGLTSRLATTSSLSRSSMSRGTWNRWHRGAGVFGSKRHPGAAESRCNPRAR